MAPTLPLLIALSIIWVSRDFVEISVYLSTTYKSLNSYLGSFFWFRIYHFYILLYLKGIVVVRSSLNLYSLLEFVRLSIEINGDFFFLV